MTMFPSRSEQVRRHKVHMCVYKKKVHLKLYHDQNANLSYNNPYLIHVFSIPNSWVETEVKLGFLVPLEYMGEDMMAQGRGA